MLPPGKQAFVMSQDDVCYYEYMEGDGFASSMVVGEDGKPVCEMKMMTEAFPQAPTISFPC